MLGKLLIIGGLLASELAYGQVSTYPPTGGSGGGGMGDPGSNGLMVRTALNTSVARTMALGTPGCLTITNGNGVSGNPTITVDPACITLFSTSTGLPSALSDFATAGPGERLHLKTDTGQAWLSFANSDFRQLILAASNGAMNVPSNAGDVSAPSNGQVWYDSTANKFRARENGSTVDLRGGGGTSYTAPPNSGWSTTNAQANVTITGTSTYQMMVNSGSLNAGFTSSMRTVAAGDFTLTAAFYCDAATTYNYCGIIADRGDANNTDIRRIIYTIALSGLNQNEKNQNSFGLYGYFYKNSASDTWLSAFEGFTGISRTTLHWIRLARSGSNLTWSWSPDGVIWVPGPNDTESNWLGGAITRLGFGMNRSTSSASTPNGTMILVHWSVQ